jgi:hypothetical protein
VDDLRHVGQHCDCDTGDAERFKHGSSQPPRTWRGQWLERQAPL